VESISQATLAGAGVVSVALSRAFDVSYIDPTVLSEPRVIGEVVHAPLTGWLSLLAFLYFTGPKAFRIRDLYLHVTRGDSIPAWRRARVTDVNIKMVQGAIFYYLVLMLYEVAISLLVAFGVRHIVLDVLDPIVQLSLLGHVLATHAEVARDLRFRNRADPAKQAQVDAWLQGKLDGLGLSYNDLRWSVGKIAMLALPLAAARLWTSLSPGLNLAP
jgi:hypothetical protein